MKPPLLRHPTHPQLSSVYIGNRDVVIEELMRAPHQMQASNTAIWLMVDGDHKPFSLQGIHAAAFSKLGLAFFHGTIYNRFYREVIRRLYEIRGN